MKDLLPLTEEAKMSSREIAEMYGKNHFDVLRKIRGLEESYVVVFGVDSKFTVNEYKDSIGRSLPEILLNKSQALFVAGRFDAVLHARVQKRWEELETERQSSVVIETQLQKKLLIAETAVRMLRLNEGSKIKMLSIISESEGVSPTYLPSYTEEKLTRSLTQLLGESGCLLSAKKMNTVLQQLGIIERMSRPSSSKGVKYFWSLTEEGLSYGKNLINPNNPKETQPHYYVDTFKDLLAMADHFLEATGE